MLKQRPRHWLTQDWMQYLSARAIYNKRDDPAPPQTYGETMEGWFKILYGEDLDTYIERVTKEIKEKNLK